MSTPTQNNTPTYTDVDSVSNDAESRRVTHIYMHICNIYMFAHTYIQYIIHPHINTQYTITHTQN